MSYFKTIKKMTTLAACFPHNDKEINIYNFFSIKSNEKPPLTKTIEFLEYPNKTLINIFKKSISMLEEVQAHILENKISNNECKKLHSDTKKLSGGINSIIGAISSFEIDNKTTIELIDFLKRTQILLSEIRDISGTYIDIDQSRKDFENGNTLTHDQVWGTE